MGYLPLLLRTTDGLLSTVENSLSARYSEAHRLELQERVTALNEGRAPTLAMVEDGAQAARAAAAAVKSMRSGGRFVRVEETR